MKKTEALANHIELWPINNLWFVLILAILTFLITYLSGEGRLYKNGDVRWWKKLTKKGWIAIIGIVFICIMVLQELNNKTISNQKDEEITNKENQLKSEQKNRDSTITAGINDGVEKSNDKLFKNLLRAFEKQGLQYDTIKNEIVTLKKSSNSHPLLRIIDLKLLDSTNYLPKRYKFSYELTSYDSPSYNTHVLFDIFGFTPEGKIVGLDRNRDLLYEGQTIPKEIGFTSYIGVIVNYRISLYAFRLKGFYFSSDKTKIPVDDIYLLQIQNKKMSFVFPGQFHENAIRQYIAINKF